jgi:hypothetical protein
MNSVDLRTLLSTAAGFRKHLSQFRGGAMLLCACLVIDPVVGLPGEPDRIDPFLRKAC